MRPLSIHRQSQRSSKSSNRSSKSPIRRPGSSGATDVWDCVNKTLSREARKSGERYESIVSSHECFKASPSVIPNPNPVTEECLNVERRMWRETFASMGGLYRIGPKEHQPMVQLASEPYHCSSTGIHFDAHYGQMNQVSMKTVDEYPMKKDVRKSRSSLVPITRMPLMITRNKRSDNSWFPKLPPEGTMEVTTHELPPSCVLAKWAIGPRMPAYTPDDISEWLTRFGNVFFTLPDTDQSIFVAFDEMMSAYRAVNYRSLPSHLKITWCHLKFYNYGQVKPLQDYKLSTDPKWKAVIIPKHRKRTASFKMEGEHLGGKDPQSEGCHTFDFQFKLGTDKGQPQRYIGCELTSASQQPGSPKTETEIDTDNSGQQLSRPIRQQPSKTVSFSGNESTSVAPAVSNPPSQQNVTQLPTMTVTQCSLNGVEGLAVTTPGTKSVERRAYGSSFN